MGQFYIWVFEYRVNSNTVLYCVIIAFPDIYNSIQAIIMYLLFPCVPQMNNDRYKVRIRYMRVCVCVCVRMCVNDLNSFE